MLHDDRIRVIHDYIRADDVFPGVEIKGGVCYFLWDRDNRGLCQVVTHLPGNIISTSERPLLENAINVFIRYNAAVAIFHKTSAKKEKSFMDIVSPGKPFGFRGFFNDFRSQSFPDSVKIYANHRSGYVERAKITQNLDWVDKYKIFVPKAWGMGNIATDWIKPFIVEPNTCCTETYLVIGPFANQEIAKNVISYTQTRFFHLFLSFRKITQDTWKNAYQFVPLQDFSEPWTDEKLYAKYGLTQEEIAFIESMVRPMEAGE